MSKNILIILAVIIVALVLVFVLVSGNKNSNTVNPSEPPNISALPTLGMSPLPSQTPAVSLEQTSSVIVTYTDSGFAPSSVNIKVGQTATFKNESSQSMWVASGVHPTHKLYSGTALSDHCPDTSNTAFDECQGIPAGQSWSFTFEKSGTWGYHNHLHAADKGTVVVQ